MDFIDLKTQYKKYKGEIDKKIQENIDNATFINGKDKKLLEEKLAAYVGVKHAIGCGSGTDALLIPLMAYGVKAGDEIITTPFTFIATAEVISFIGAKPVFIDIDEKNYNIDINQIEKKITGRTKGIIPVSLYGQVPDMDKINAIAKKHNLFVIEDACQSFGSIYNGKKSCGLTDVGATSFFPSKPLGCYGDGGMIFTSDDALAAKMRSLVDHGQTERYIHKYIGYNFRLDTIQAAVLLAKFAHFEEEADVRFSIGRKYAELLKGSKAAAPHIEPFTTRSVFAQYSVRVKNRAAVIEHLGKAGIPTAIHYPIPIHMQEAYSYLGYKKGDFPAAEKIAGEIMSIPMHPFLTPDQQKIITDSIKEIAE
jgi:UDP-2-acetamido-2-deoxy-ribo-hexuluronate aminotransferase